MLILYRVWINLILLLCRISSASLVLLLLLLVLLLKKELLLLQNLDLVSIFNRGRSLGIWWLVRWHKDNILRNFWVFFIFTLMVLEIELIAMRWVSLCGQWMINNIDMWILLYIGSICSWILVKNLYVLFDILFLSISWSVSVVSISLISWRAFISTVLDHHSSSLSVRIWSLIGLILLRVLSLNLLHSLRILKLSNLLVWSILRRNLMLLLLHNFLVLKLNIVIMHLLVVHKIVCFNLHLLKHNIHVRVIHWKLLSDLILLSHFFIYDSLMFLLVISTLISLMRSSCLLWIHFLLCDGSWSSLNMSSLINLLLRVISLVWL